jgi:hypothetical protein
MRRPPFHLVGGHVSGDTTAVLEELLAEARKGEVLGVAFCVMYKGREFIADATGEARRNPVFARGMVAFLDDQLAQHAYDTRR